MLTYISKSRFANDEFGNASDFSEHESYDLSVGCEDGDVRIGAGSVDDE